jgi:23S rRNA (adenine1618-N6)-methyltransferase
LHHKNRHNGSYDFELLTHNLPELTNYIVQTKFGGLSIDFANPKAVKSLNKALLFTDYGITYWEIPEGYLCPPIPGRADYLHHISELVPENQKDITCLDIGVGANCIYPIIGVKEYGWNFVGTDIDPKSVETAKKIVNQNNILKEKVEIRLQENKIWVFNGVVKPTEKFDISICNPPFHLSKSAADKGTLRKISHLQQKNTPKLQLNFGGNSNELWCEGGEMAFIEKMIQESSIYRQNIVWFTTLVSKESHLKPIYFLLKKAKVKIQRTFDMQLGNKVSRIVAWQF